MHVITLLLIEWEFISIINCTCYSVTYVGTRPLNKGTNRPITLCTIKLFIQLMYNKTTILQSGLFFVRYLMSSFAYTTLSPPRPKTPFTYVMYLYSDI